MSLLRLDMYEAMPLLGGLSPALAGWDSKTFGSGDVSTFHHPSGDLLKYSRGVARYKSSNFLTVTWGRGTTEGGSSGGALLNSTGQVIGTLWGGSSSCSEPSLPDYYGRFSAAYSRGLRNWLHMPAQELVAAVDLNGSSVRSLLFRPRVASKAGTHSYAAAGMGLTGLGSGADLRILGWSQVGQNSDLIWGQPKFVAVTDVTGDGREDLVYRITGADGMDQIRMVHMDDDDEALEVETLHSGLDKSIVVVGMGDLDGDGIPDLVLRDPKTYKVAYLLRKLDAEDNEYKYEPLTMLGGSKYLTPLAVGNFHGDARAEVLYRDSRYPSYALIDAYDAETQDMGENFFLGRLKTLPGKLVATADLNGDGRLDLVFNSSGKISYAYSEDVGEPVLPYSSDYQMGTPVTALSATQTSGMSFSLLADFDADGKADMVWRHKTTGELAYTLSSRSARMPLVLTKPEKLLTAP